MTSDENVTVRRVRRQLWLGGVRGLRVLLHGRVLRSVLRSWSSASALPPR